MRAMVHTSSNCTGMRKNFMCNLLCCLASSCGSSNAFGNVFGGSRRNQSGSKSSSTTSCIPPRISFVTDVEGDLSYLRRFVEISEVITYGDEEDRKRIDFLDDGDSNGAHLVFGGDICDKGGNDLEVMRQLLDFKERYPDRVHLILGNRDVNKIRMSQEIGGLSTANAVSEESNLRPLPEHEGTWWLKDTGIVGDPIGDLRVPDTVADRLKWMLKSTMGSPNAYEFRRAELAEEAEKEDVAVDITDNDVVRSYRDFASPNGLIGNYLSHGLLATRIGNALFVHGALPMSYFYDCESSSFSYPTPWNGATVTTLDKFIFELNQFVRHQYEIWKDSIEKYLKGGSLQVWSTNGGYNSGIAGGDLVQYSMGWMPGKKERNPSIVYSQWIKDEIVHNKIFQQFFDENNLQAIITGHQPNGDAPSCIRVDSKKIIVSADTSYSGDVEWAHAHECDDEIKEKRSSKSFRGDIAVSELLLDFDEKTGEIKRIISHGILSNGEIYKSSDLLVEPEVGLAVKTDSDGKSEEEWWTKFRNENGSYLVSRTEGYSVTNAIVEDLKNLNENPIKN